MSDIVLKIDSERVKEIPMVDLAFELLKAANQPYYYRDLIVAIAKIRGLSDDALNQVIAQVYTEINIDGRFACVGGNMWGLKRWYPVEKSEDAISNSKRPRIINDEDDDDLFPDEEEESYVQDEEEYESYDEVQSLYDDADSDDEVDEPVLIDGELEEEEEEEDDLSLTEEDEEEDFA